MNKIIAGVAFFIGFGSAGFGQRAYLSRELQNIDAGKRVNVIVRFKHAPDAAHHRMVRDLGGTLRASFGVIRGAAYSAPAGTLESLAENPEVLSISPDRPVHMLLDNTTAAVNASAAWNAGLDGSGIGVAVIDSGISDHQDLHGGSGSRVVYSESFTGGDSTDGFGHGEHVAGILAGNGSDSSCAICDRHFVGVAPNVNLIDLQVLDSTGAGTDSNVIAAIDRAVQLKAQFNIRVINLSLGRPVYESYTVDPLCQAVESAWKAGIVVVTAAGNGGRDNPAGNNGYGTITAPGNDPYVITVGAMKSMGTPQRTDDLIASYSSKGPTQVDHIVKPDLVAPGNLVVSLLSPNGVLPTLYPQDVVPISYYEQTSQSTSSTSYLTLSGTSMATPVV
ncbi:MAG: S8 family serine peptidase, partial [Acidobacteriaceae bacterium]|nr:S8 family serine peptidase [Acidobacteriaceae bacterium]